MNHLLPIIWMALIAASQAAEPSGAQRGVASWYAENSGTASGEHYNPSGMTAAHRTLPLGTMVQVKNLSTGCCCTVRINDRGPFRKGRIIDVSKAAAQKLRMIEAGTANVELVVVQ